MKSHSWKRVLACLFLVKAVYLAGVIVSVTVWPDFDEQRFHAVNARWPREGGPAFASHFATWDAAHYLFLSEIGYSKGVASCAFYPLWPLAIRWFSMVTGSSHLITGMVLANVLSLAAWVLFHNVVARRFGESVALWALVFLIIFPGALFYQFIYSEPLFFLLVMLLWFGLERGRFGLAWIAAFLLPLSRGVGVFSVLPIAWYWLMRRQGGWLERWRWLDAERERLRSDPAVNAVDARRQEYALMAAPLLGLAVYFALIWAWTGNPFEGFEAQKYWRVHSISNLWNLPKFVIGFFGPTTWHEFRGSVLDRCAFMLLIYCLPLIWRLGKDMALWTYVLGILPAMSGTFVSFTRFESTAFPLFIALAVFFTGRKRRWPLASFVLVLSIVHLILLWRFVNFRWAG